MCAEIRSVPTSNSLLVPEPESQLVPADYAVPELVEPTPPPPATLFPDRQTGGQKLPDRQKESVQNGRWVQDRSSLLDMDIFLLTILIRLKRTKRKRQ
jgi:hypothetical protein